MVAGCIGDVLRVSAPEMPVKEDALEARIFSLHFRAAFDFARAHGCPFDDKNSKLASACAMRTGRLPAFHRHPAAAEDPCVCLVSACARPAALAHRGTCCTFESVSLSRSCVHALSATSSSPPPPFHPPCAVVGLRQVKSFLPLLDLPSGVELTVELFRALLDAIRFASQSSCESRRCVRLVVMMPRFDELLPSTSLLNLSPPPARTHVPMCWSPTQPGQRGSGAGRHAVPHERHARRAGGRRVRVGDGPSVQCAAAAGARARSRSLPLGAAAAGPLRGQPANAAAAPVVRAPSLSRAPAGGACLTVFSRRLVSRHRLMLAAPASFFCLTGRLNHSSLT